MIPDRSAEISRPKVLFVLEGFGDASAELYRFAAPRTADALLKRLPVQGRAAIYGEEVYFKVPVKAPAENPRPTIEVGCIGYWPMGDAICVFFGPTRPYSPVNLLGRITTGLDLFRRVKEGTLIEVRKA
jgi:uncharacterized protein